MIQSRAYRFKAMLEATEADVICVEDLAVKALMRTRMAKSIGDAAWGEIVRQLTYKAEWKGKSVVKIDRWLPSSQVCSGCGQVHSEMKDLKVRRMVCECGVDLDRDHNAALNILRWGLEVWRNQVGQGMAEPTPLRFNACGEPSAGAGTVVPFATGSARHGSPKQELTGICTAQHLVAAA
jgi:putative transposase